MNQGPPSSLLQPDHSVPLFCPACEPAELGSQQRPFQATRAVKFIAAGPLCGASAMNYALCLRQSQPATVETSVWSVLPSLSGPWFVCVSSACAMELFSSTKSDRSTVRPHTAAFELLLTRVYGQNIPSHVPFNRLSTSYSVRRHTQVQAQSPLFSPRLL